jgi:A/G-specific adenine glycosylase
LPLVETESELTDENIARIQLSFCENERLIIQYISSPIKHILSHQVIFARIIHLQAGANFELKSPYLRISRENLFQYPVPRLIEKLIAKVK